ncbi:ATP-dependent protease Clp, ATPase subunit, partial [Snodgrassella alvi SCGC AB-598-J21]
MSKEIRYCSFCGKPENEVKNLIEGENALICNECVDTCNEMLHNPGASSTENGMPAADG